MTYISSLLRALLTVNKKVPQGYKWQYNEYLKYTSSIYPRKNHNASMNGDIGLEGLYSSDHAGVRVHEKIYEYL